MQQTNHPKGGFERGLPFPFGGSMSIRFSKSKLNTYLSCPRKYYLHYELGMRAKKASKTLIEGSAIHHIVESGLVYRQISDIAEESSRIFWEDNPFENCCYETEQEYLSAQQLCLFQSKKFLEGLGPLPALRMEMEYQCPLIRQPWKQYAEINWNLIGDNVFQ